MAAVRLHSGCLARAASQRTTGSFIRLPRARERDVPIQYILLHNPHQEMAILCLFAIVFSSFPTFLRETTTTTHRSAYYTIYMESSMIEIDYTTGNRDFAECKILCRVSKIGHSAKTFFAECCTRQRIALGKHGHSAKDFFAECQTLGKISTLGRGCPRNGVRSRPSLPSACC